MADRTTRQGSVAGRFSSVMSFWKSNFPQQESAPHPGVRGQPQGLRSNNGTLRRDELAASPPKSIAYRRDDEVKRADNRDPVQEPVRADGLVRAEASTREPEHCNICLEEAVDMIFGICDKGCNKSFCKPCCRSYFLERGLKAQQERRAVGCPAAGCTGRVPYSCWKTLVPKVYYYKDGPQTPRQGTNSDMFSPRGVPRISNSSMTSVDPRLDLTAREQAARDQAARRAISADVGQDKAQSVSDANMERILRKVGESEVRVLAEQRKVEDQLAEYLRRVEKSINAIARAQTDMQRQVSRQLELHQQDAHRMQDKALERRQVDHEGERGGRDQASAQEPQSEQLSRVERLLERLADNADADKAVARTLEDWRQLQDTARRQWNEQLEFFERQKRDWARLQEPQWQVSEADWRALLARVDALAAPAKRADAWQPSHKEWTALHDRVAEVAHAKGAAPPDWTVPRQAWEEVQQKLDQVWQRTKWQLNENEWNRHKDVLQELSKRPAAQAPAVLERRLSRANSRFDLAPSFPQPEHGVLPSPMTRSRSASAFRQVNVEQVEKLEAKSLARAVSEGSLKEVEDLLAGGAAPDLQDEGGTLAHTAAGRGHADVLALLVKSGADMEARDLAGCTPLHVAVIAGQLDTAEWLVRAKAQLEATTPDCHTALHLAAAEGKEAAVALLIRHKASINAKSQGSITALHLAVDRAHLDVVTCLIANKCKVDEATDADETPLLLAAINGSEPVARALLKAGANPNHATAEGLTPLLAAYDNSIMVTALLESRADPNKLGPSKVSPLLLACKDGKENSVRALLTAKADGSSTAALAYSTLLAAVEHGHSAIVALLLLHSTPNIEEENFEGYTPLEIACQRGYEDIAITLIANGANVHHVPKDGNAAWKLARDGLYLEALRAVYRADKAKPDLNEALDAALGLLEDGFKMHQHHDGKKLNTLVTLELVNGLGCLGLETGGNMQHIPLSDITDFMLGRQTTWRLAAPADCCCSIMAGPETQLEAKNAATMKAFAQTLVLLLTIDAGAFGAADEAEPAGEGAPAGKEEEEVDNRDFRRTSSMSKPDQPMAAWKGLALCKAGSPFQALVREGGNAGIWVHLVVKGKRLGWCEPGTTNVVPCRSMPLSAITHVVGSAEVLEVHSLTHPLLAFKADSKHTVDAWVVGLLHFPRAKATDAPERLLSATDPLALLQLGCGFTFAHPTEGPFNLFYSADDSLCGSLFWCAEGKTKVPGQDVALSSIVDIYLGKTDQWAGKAGPNNTIFTIVGEKKLCLQATEPVIVEEFLKTLQKVMSPNEELIMPAAGDDDELTPTAAPAPPQAPPPEERPEGGEELPDEEAIELALALMAQGTYANMYYEGDSGPAVREVLVFYDAKDAADNLGCLYWCAAGGQKQKLDHQKGYLSTLTDLMMDKQTPLLESEFCREVPAEHCLSLVFQTDADQDGEPISVQWNLECSSAETAHHWLDGLAHVLRTSGNITVEYGDEHP